MTFTIKPRPRNDGVTLTSDALGFPMWYDDIPGAVYYAKFRAGNESARIEVLNADGEVLRTIEHESTWRDNIDRLGGL
jgi:hypothetical protein